MSFQVSILKSKTPTVPIISTVGISVFFWIHSNDPFNSPKFWILLISAAWLLGQLTGRWREYSRARKYKGLFLSVGIFMLANLLEAIFASNKFYGFFGQYQRRTGALTYIAFAIFLLTTALLGTSKKVNLIRRATLGLGSFFAIYGVLQVTKHDPIHWNNPYNSILLTLGNPDFSSALLAIISVLIVVNVFQSNLNKYTRYYSGFLSIVLITLIVKTQANQGILAFGIGLSILLFVKLLQISKKIAILCSVVIVASGFSIILGILGNGPFGFLHKPSVIARGNYFRAAWKMFMQHPLFGVGLDRYGAYFRPVRDAKQILMNGPQVISNNAHNVPLQLLATGGLFLFITYIVVIFFIGYRGIKALQQTSDGEQLFIAGVFGAWFAYVAQSFVSIDNIGIAIWGWMLGGLVCGLSFENHTTIGEKNAKLVKNQTTKSPNFASIASWMLVIPAFTISLLMFLSETSLQKALSTQRPSQVKLFPLYQQILEKPLTFPFVDPYMRVLSANHVATVNAKDAERLLLQNIKADSHDFESKSLLAAIYEGTNDFTSALSVRIESVKLDPLNYENLLLTAKDADKTGDKGLMRKYASQVLELAPHGPIRDDAILLLAK